MFIANLRNATKILTTTIFNKRRHNKLVAPGGIKSQACAGTPYVKEKQLVSHSFTNMSARRQTRRTAKRGCRLSQDGNPSLDDSTENVVFVSAGTPAAVEQNVESRTSTPAPKRLANEMGDIEDSAAKRQHSESRTPVQPSAHAAGETAQQTPTKLTPTKYATSDEMLACWSTMCKKLTRAVSTTAAQSAAPSVTAETQKSKAADLTVDELCDEMFKRIAALGKRSDAEKRDVAFERGAGAMNEMCKVLANLRQDPKAQQYLNSVSTGGLVEPQIIESRSAENMQPSTSYSSQSALSKTCPEKPSKTHSSLERNHDEIDVNGGNTSQAFQAVTSRLVQPSRGASPAARAHNDHVARQLMTEARHAEYKQMNRHNNSPYRGENSGTVNKDKSCGGLVFQTYPECEESNSPPVTIDKARYMQQRYDDALTADYERMLRRRKKSAERRCNMRERDEYNHYIATVADEHDRDDKIIIPKFDGKDWPAFKSVFESVAAHKKWKPDFKALQLKCLITGDARAALNVVDSSDWSYEQLVEHFEQRCGKNKTKVQVMTALDKLYRKPEQSLTAWRDEVITVANSGVLTEKQYRELTHYTFLRGLGTYPQMLHWVSERDSDETLQSCYETAKRYEREIGTPGLVATRPSRVAALSATAEESMAPEPEVQVKALTGQNTASAASASHPVLEQVAKTNQEATELIEKLQKELAQAKKRNNFKWRGGRGRGRGTRGRGSFQFGKKPGSYHVHSCDVEPEELDRRIAAEECAAYNEAKSKKKE